MFMLYMFYVLCLHLYFVYTFPQPFDKADPTMAFAEQLSWHWERRMQAQSFLRPVHSLLTPKP